MSIRVDAPASNPHQLPDGGLDTPTRSAGAVSTLALPPPSARCKSSSGPVVLESDSTPFRTKLADALSVDSERVSSAFNQSRLGRVQPR